MEAMCDATFEFKVMCARLVKRLPLQLQQWDKLALVVQEGGAVSFASIMFRVCRLLLQIETQKSGLLRSIGSRATTSRIKGFHEELDHLDEILKSPCAGSSWTEQFDEELLAIQARFEDMLRNDDFVRVWRGFYNFDDCDEAVLLRCNLEVCEKEGNSEERERSQRMVNRFLHVNNESVCEVLDWSVSRDDVEFYGWNIVRSNRVINIYDGKWRNSSVTIETSDLPKRELREFEKNASRLYQLNHPHLVKFFVLVTSELRAFSSTSRRQLLFVHGNLQIKNIVVNSGCITKLRVVGNKQPKLSKFFDVRSRTEVTVADNIYAFGLCILEAATLELSRETPLSKIGRMRLTGANVQDRPTGMNDSAWDLITKMCAFDPRERVNIAYVASKLKQFALESEHHDGGIPTNRKIGKTETQENGMDGHWLPELDGTVLNTLQSLRSKCEQLHADQWMVKLAYPALEIIFNILLERHFKPSDIEVVDFCSTVSRFQRLLRTATSKAPVLRLARSRNVAETHHVIYSELDRLLDILGVPATDSIRAWRSDTSVAGDQQTLVNGLLSDTSSSCMKKTTGTGDSSSMVSVHLFDSPTAKQQARANAESMTAPTRWYLSIRDLVVGKSLTSHERWSKADLATSRKFPAWYLSLRDLRVWRSNEFGIGSFGTVYKGSWLGTPIVVKFMGYEEDFGTISTDLLLHELYGACYVDKRYFVCEYASNGDLLDYLKKPRNDSLVWQKMYEAAQGLQYLHSQDVAHNDLKCGNIMVGMDGKAKLIDFGLSCLLNEVEIQIDVKQMKAVNWRSPGYLAGGRPSFASDV